MTLTVIELQVLSSISDDDYFLYEVEWELNTHYPERRGETNRLAAIETLRRLYERGLVEASWFTERLALIRPLSATEFAEQLKDAENWVPGCSGPRCIQVTTTDAGFQECTRAYRARPPESPGQ